MKSILVFVAILFHTSTLTGQVCLIAGHPSDGGYLLPFFNEIDLNCNQNGTKQSKIDLDADSVYDITFIAERYYGGTQTYSSLVLFVSMGFMNFIDSNYYATKQYYDTNGLQTVLEKTTIVRRFNAGDTVCFNDYKDTLDYRIADYYESLSPLQFTPLNIPQFIGDTTYIAVCYEDIWIQRIFLLKVFVSHYSRIQIFEVRTNDASLGLGVERSPDQVKVFPNPFNNLVNIEAVISKIEVISLEGRLVYSENTRGIHHKLDLGYLDSGMYLLLLTGDNGTSYYKILKL